MEENTFKNKNTVKDKRSLLISVNTEKYNQDENMQ
jgi:hypothetical protein